MNNADIEKIITEYKRKSVINPEIIELIKDDLKYGISKEAIDGYAKDVSLSVSQKKIYSECLRNVYPIEFINLLMEKQVDEPRSRMAMDFYEKGMSIEQISEVLEQKPETPAVMRRMLQTIYEGLSNFTEDVDDNKKLLGEFQKQMDIIVNKFESHEEMIHQMLKHIQEHENTDYNEEMEKLLKQLADIEKDLEREREISRERNITMIELREGNRELRNSLQSLKDEMQRKDKELQKEKEKVESLSGQTETKENTIPEMTASNEHTKVQSKMSKPMIDTYMVTGAVGRTYMVEKNTERDRKKSPAAALVRKLFFSRRANRNLMRKVIENNLAEGQIRQVVSGMEKGLTYEQLEIMIESKAEPEKMAGIIELAALENSLEMG